MSIPPTKLRSRLSILFELSLAHFGPQHWWPADSTFEVCVGAILTQNTAWTNVERAISHLKKARALSPRALDTMPMKTLAALLKPAGYFNLKAKRLKNFVRYLL